MVLSATVRPMVGSLALYTTPMAPRPSSPTISYLPILCREVVVIFTYSGCLSSGGEETSGPLPPHGERQNLQFSKNSPLIQPRSMTVDSFDVTLVSSPRAESKQ